MNYVGYNEDHL